MRLFKVALVLVAAVLVVVCLPRENKFGYEYEMGRPWKYGQLIASYDFPIYKPDAQLQRERDSVRNSSARILRPTSLRRGTPYARSARIMRPGASRVCRTPMWCI